MTKLCIDSDTLASYFGGSLSDEEKIRMMAHITECRTCLEKFASASSIMKNSELDDWEPASEKTTRDFLKRKERFLASLEMTMPAMLEMTMPKVPGTDASGKSLRDRITACYNRIVSPLTEMLRVTDPVWVRSGKALSQNEMCLMRKVGNLQTEIYAEESESGNSTIRVKVFSGNQNAENISLTLIKDDGKMFARNLRGESVRFDDLPQGCYQFILEQNGHEKGRCVFEISEKGLHEKDNLS